LVSFKSCTYSRCEWRSDSLVCTNTDTTEIKEAEEKVEHQQELEAVEERTKDLLEKNSLETQNQELHKTNSELDRFVYSTSHDLRAPKINAGFDSYCKRK
jgi:light-regulated signal transduction histidine kinase (bacteriophytochrome)